MKTNPRWPHVHIPFFKAIALLLLHFQSYAVVNTYQWPAQVNQRGFVLKQVSNSSDFVAAGTIYDMVLAPSYGNLHGFQFMHLDANGHVLSTKIHYLSNTSSDLISYRVVDIAEGDITGTGGFIITLQVNDKTPGKENDYILIYHVDINGNEDHHHHIKTDVTFPVNHKNLYATSTLIYNHCLFICGYAGENSEYPNQPDIYSTDKLGMLIKVFAGGIRICLWDSPNGATSYDYDMATKMYLSESGTPSLLLTGAANVVNSSGNTNYSGILAMSFDPNSSSFTPTPTYSNVLADPGGAPIFLPPIPAMGTYGKDIIDNGNGDVFILANGFLGYTLGGWNIVNVMPTMLAPSGTNTVWLGAANNHWANQFYTDVTNMGSTQDITVVGEQVNPYCSAMIPPPSLAPSFNNVDPFIGSYTLSGYGTGALSGTVNWHKIQLSSLGTHGTGGSNIDYFLGRNGKALEDVTRLYNFSTQVGNNMNGDIAMIAPVANIPGGTGELTMKFLRTNSFGDEPDCNNVLADCAPTVYNGSVNNYNINFQYSYRDPGFVPDELIVDASLPVNEFLCSTGFYKAANAATQVEKDDLVVQLTPQPTSGVINITFSRAIRNNATFTLIDMVGKVVYEKNNIIAGISHTAIQLPTLAPGTYLAKIVADGDLRTEQIIIE